MRFQRALFVFNPVSGGGTDNETIRAIRRRLLRVVPAVHLAPTRFPNHAADLARKAIADGCDLMVVQGGDGTVNEVAQGLAGHDSPAILVLPGGTANVLVKEVGLPSDPLEVVAALPSLAVKAVSLGLVEFSSGNSRFFVLMCGAGLDAAIAAGTPTHLKAKLGLGAYWLRGSGQMLRPFPRLRLTGKRDGNGSGATTSQVVVSKSRTYGVGMVLAPNANLLSDRLEIASFAGTGRFRYCGYFLATVLAATAWWPGIQHSTGTEVLIEPSGTGVVHVQVDGEVAGALPARVSASPHTIRVLMPPAYGELPPDTDL